MASIHLHILGQDGTPLIRHGKSDTRTIEGVDDVGEIQDTLDRSGLIGSFFRKTDVELLNPLGRKARVTEGETILYKPQRQVAEDAEEVEYQVPPLDSLEDFSFDLPVPPVMLLSSDIQRGKQNLKACLSTSFFTVEAQRYSHIALAVVVFLRRRYSGEAEDSVHAVNDSMFEIIEVLGGEKQYRNSVSQGSRYLKRYDSYFGNPPSIPAEEKAEEKDLQEAEKELTDKAAPIPHYKGLPFTIGIAAARSDFSFSLLKDKQVVRRTPPISNRTLAGQVQILRAAVNCGRFLRYVRDNRLVLPSPVGFYTNHNDGRRILFLAAESVVKTYLTLSPQAMAHLEAFYQACAGVKHCEQGFCKRLYDRRQEPAGLEVTLMPVGISRLPQSVDELKVACKCLLTCMDGIHNRGWTHNDIRWPNVIYISKAEWVLIDCEDVLCQDGQSRIRKNPHNPEFCNKIATARTDLAMFGKMISSAAEKLSVDDEEFGDFIAHCCFAEKYEETAESLRSHAWLKTSSETGDSPRTDSGRVSYNSPVQADGIDSSSLPVSKRAKHAASSTS